VQSSGQLIEHFRAQGLKVTPQRQCIFEALVSTAGWHPTAEVIWAEVVRHMPAVSLKTVYQTLNDLSTMGVVSHVDIGTGSARFDTNTDRHQHVVCNRCNRVWASTSTSPKNGSSRSSRRSSHKSWAVGSSSRAVTSS